MLFGPATIGHDERERETAAFILREYNALLRSDQAFNNRQILSTFRKKLKAIGLSAGAAVTLLRTAKAAFKHEQQQSAQDDMNRRPSKKLRGTQTAITSKSTSNEADLKHKEVLPTRTAPPAANPNPPVKPKTVETDVNGNIIPPKKL